MTQHQLGQIKQKLSKLSQKFELVAAGFILRFTRNLKIAPTIILLSLLITHYSSLAFASTTWTETTDTNFNDGIYYLTKTSGTGTGAQLALDWRGTGADGSVSITATKNINTDVISSGRSYADGINYAVSAIYTSSITCSATVNGIEAGDEVILINMQGDSSNYGNVGGTFYKSCV